MEATADRLSASARNLQSPVLVLDLDGTLVRTNLLLESLVLLLKQEPWCLFLLPFWLARGRAHCKHEIARRVSLDVSTLPYREELLEFARRQRDDGRTIVLATGCDSEIAHQVADHLNVFDVVQASDGVTNLVGLAKRDHLVGEFGQKGFDYAGNARKDLPVWAAGRRAIVLNPSKRLRARVGEATEILCEDHPRKLADYLSALRPRHWLKNGLLFVSLLAAHRIGEFGLLGRLLMAFLAFGCIASSGYLLNDLFDLEADRRHPTKRLRAFAAGRLPLAYALIMIPLLALVASVIGSFLSWLFLATLWLYWGLSLAYSMALKRIVILDVIVLAGLYSLRILAGATAVSIWPSHWLLAFSTFLFFSLALVKRYGELAVMKRVDGERAEARGYELGDAELLAAMGVASGYLAVLVFALYINTYTAQTLYGRDRLNWFLCPLLLYWISHVWLVAHRGKMPDDPVAFATHDRISYILAALMAAVIILAL